MDLEENCPKSKSERVGREENRDEDETLLNALNFYGNKIVNNAESDHGIGYLDKVGTFNAIESPSDVTWSALEPVTPIEDGVGEGICDESSSKLRGSPENEASDTGALKPAAKKGYGLKKWRRIRRDVNKDVGGSADSALILKRRLTLAEPRKAREESKPDNDGVGEVEAEGEESLVSSDSRNATVVGMAPLEIASGALGPELELLVTATGFSVGADSDNSEDRSCKSSTAVSAPRPRHETGFGRDRSRVKSSGRGSGHSLQQRGQRGRGSGIEGNRKVRGDQVRFEKEGSLSSVESSLRSSNTGSGRRGSLVSNGKKSESLLSYDGEHSDEGQVLEGGKSVYYKENGRIEDEDADLLEESVKNNENAGAQTDVDPLIESMMLLQAAQEALENEIQKFEEVAKEPIVPLRSNAQFEETEGSSSAALEGKITELNQKIKHFEAKLEEASAAAKEKELKVLELEAILNNTQPSERETASCNKYQQECEEVELELENLLKQKLEAEIEYLTIANTTRSWKVSIQDQCLLFEDQKSLLKDQAQIISKLRDAEDSLITLKEHAEKLEASCKDLLGTEEVLKLQNKACRSSVCCFIQFMMLCIALALFLTQLFPPSNGVVPT